MSVPDSQLATKESQEPKKRAPALLSLGRLLKRLCDRHRVWPVHFATFDLGQVVTRFPPTLQQIGNRPSLEITGRKV